MIIFDFGCYSGYTGTPRARGLSAEGSPTIIFSLEDVRGRIEADSHLRTGDFGDQPPPELLECRQIARDRPNPFPGEPTVDPDIDVNRLGHNKLNR